MSRSETKEAVMRKRTYMRKEAILEAPESLCLERGRMYTKIYKENEDTSYVIRRAMALAYYLDNMTIKIYDGELIVGSYASKLGATVLYPEYTFQNQAKRYKDFENDEQVEETKEAAAEREAVEELYEYWHDKNVHARADATIPAFVQQSRDHKTGGNPYGRDEGQGHIAVEYDKIINEGFRPTIEKAKKRMAEVIASDPNAYEFLHAVVITSEATIRFAHRYADLAQDLHDKESDPVRKQELLDIVTACRNVPENPARTFKEACQAFWFVHLIMHFEQNGFSISPGRFDQYMNPLYLKDLDDGRMTRESALEILEQLWVKFMEISIGGVKISLTPTMTLAGSSIDGNDLTNEMTYLVLQASRNTQMVQPQLTIRWHPNIDKGIIRAALEAIRDGSASPALLNERAVIEGLVKRGIALEDAYGYAQLGCNETGIPGKLIGGGIPRGVSLIKSIELALDGGVSRYDGKKIGVETKKLGEYENFDELLEAYTAQVKHFSRIVAIGINTMDTIHQEMAPLPFASSVMSGTIERGRDIMFETDYFMLAMGCTDFISGVNCLYAVKTCVFDEKTVTQDELRKALEANFEGYDDVRNKLWQAEKFGNDEDSVDSLIPVVEKISWDAITPYSSVRKNTRWIFENIPRIAHVSEGMITGATPDGRYAGESLPAGISAQIGTDVNGPTALLNSIAKINPEMWVGGVISNARFHSDMLASEESMEKIIMMLFAYFKKGGQHLQMNCVSKEMLLDAQKHPENYRDLIVRVSGYVDYFTNLNKNSQDDIIARTAHV
jgi:formate C-acetyltransferase